VKKGKMKSFDHGFYGFTDFEKEVVGNED